MAADSNIDVSGLRFERLYPQVLEDRFDEIQNLRLQHYRTIFENQGRSLPEIEHFVGRLTLNSWSDPNEAVGRTATAGQRRPEALVTVAFDETSDLIVGYMYAAENVSSRIDRLMAKARIPNTIRTPFGDFERSLKMKSGKYYIWGNEYVHDPDRPGLASVLTTLGLETFEQDKAGTWYPWNEETVLKENLAAWGYKKDNNPAKLLKGNEGFGEGARATLQTRWVVPEIRVAINSIKNLPGASAAIDLAKSTMD